MVGFLEYQTERASIENSGSVNSWPPLCRMRRDSNHGFLDMAHNTAILVVAREKAPGLRTERQKVTVARR